MHYSVWRCDPASSFAIFCCCCCYFASSNPSLPESSCSHFFPCMHGCHFEFKMADLYRDRKIKLKCMSSCSSDHKDSKNVWLAILCPMFCNGVMGQNVKRSLSNISNCSYDPDDSRNERFYVISHSQFKL